MTDEQSAGVCTIVDVMKELRHRNFISTVVIVLQAAQSGCQAWQGRSVSWRMLESRWWESRLGKRGGWLHHDAAGSHDWWNTHLPGLGGLGSSPAPHPFTPAQLGKNSPRHGSSNSEVPAPMPAIFALISLKVGCHEWVIPEWQQHFQVMHLQQADVKTLEGPWTEQGVLLPAIIISGITALDIRIKQGDWC